MGDKKDYMINEKEKFKEALTENEAKNEKLNNLIKQKHDNEVSKLTDKIASTNAEMGKIRNELKDSLTIQDSLQERVNELEREISDVRKKIKAYEKEIEILK